MTYHGASARRLFIFEIKLNRPITCRSINPGEEGGGIASLLVNLRRVSERTVPPTRMGRAGSISGSDNALSEHRNLNQEMHGRGVKINGEPSRESA